MNTALIKQTDTVNGEGFAVSLWTQGCPFRCKGCWNDVTWDFNGGNEWSQELEDELIELFPFLNTKEIDCDFLFSFIL